MPKKTTTPNSKSQVSATKKFVSESQRQAKKDLTERWRFLRKIGAYQTKETAAQSRLTKSRVREIEKRFKEIQKSMRHLERGRTVYPVQLKTKTSKAGRKSTFYDWTPKYTFVKTKKKKPKIESGIFKTRTGYIIPRSSPQAKVSISKKGEIIETVGRTRRRKTKYTDKDLVKLLKQFDEGTYPFKKNDLIVFHVWGSQNVTIQDTPDAARAISNYIKNILNNMDPETLARFLKASWLEFVEDTGEDEAIDLT